MNPQQQQMYKYPSMSSMHSMASQGILPPGHGYIPKKQKPDKPYGLSFTSRMNMTDMGPGKKYLQYALGIFIFGLLCFLGTGLYFGHRNVSRMMVMRTEALGAVMCMSGVCCVGITAELIYKARTESNRWRANIRFKPEGLYSIVPVNEVYVPDEGVRLKSGTYGPRALREVPKPGRGKKGKSKAASRSRLATVDLPEKPGMAPPQAQVYQPEPYRPYRPPQDQGYRNQAYISNHDGQQPPAYSPAEPPRGGQYPGRAYRDDPPQGGYYPGRAYREEQPPQHRGYARGPSPSNFQPIPLSAYPQGPPESRHGGVQLGDIPRQGVSESEL